MLKVSPLEVAIKLVIAFCLFGIAIFKAVEYNYIMSFVYFVLGFAFATIAKEEITK